MPCSCVCLGRDILGGARGTPSPSAGTEVSPGSCCLVGKVHQAGVQSPGGHAPSARPPGPAAWRSPGSPPSVSLQPACPRPRQASGSSQPPSGVSLGCREEQCMNQQQRSGLQCSGQPGAGPSTHPIHPPIHARTLQGSNPTLVLSVCSPAVPAPLPGSPRVQTCTLPCTCLPAVRSSVPRALARLIQGLVWGAKALLRACPLTWGESER